MKHYYVGLDVHGKVSTFVVEDESGKVLARGELATTAQALQDMVSKHELPAGTKVGMETGTVAFYVARQLRALKMEPVVIDAREVRIKAHRPNQKSDRRDAFEICEGLRRGIYRCVVHVPPTEISDLRETLSRRRHFVRLQTAEINAVKRLLRSAGLAKLSRDLGTCRGWQRLLLSSQPWTMLHAYIQQHFELWRCAGDQVDALDSSLEKQAQQFKESEDLLTTIDGVGRVVALTAIAVFSNVSRFKNAKRAASYTGIVPCTYQSGDRDAHGRITKRGSAELRAMLCQAAHHARRPDHPLNPYFAKTCAKHGYRRAVVAVAHRLCRIMFAMLRDKASFDITKAGVERGPFERRQIRVYRLTPATGSAVTTA